MSLTITTQPTGEPLTTAEAKSYLRVDFDDDDALIDELVAAARSAVETLLQGPLLRTGFTLTLDGFPSQIRLPVGPVLASGDVSISYVDTAGATQSLADTEFSVSPGEVPRIRPAYGKTWPVTRNDVDSVTVTFTAGFASSSDVPKAVLAALRLTLTEFYDNRGAGDIPTGARNLLVPFTRWN